MNTPIQYTIRLFLCSLCWTLLLFPKPGFAQTQYEEELLENQEETVDQTELLERLERLRRAPINLNTTDAAGLTRIPFILPIHAKAIVEFRKKHGHFTTVSELTGVPNLPGDFPEILTPYLYISRPVKKPGLPYAISTRTRINRKIEKSIGFQEGIYANSPLKFYQRITFQLKDNFDFGILFEKDNGEQLLNDFQATYLKFNNLPFNSQVLLGNFSVRIGQGLIHWGSYGLGLSANPVSAILQTGRQLKPYRSVAENNALQGVGWRIETTHFNAIVFASEISRDATLDTTNSITSFYTSGLHRTETELSKINQVTEKLHGASLAFVPVAPLRIGVTYSRTNFNKKIIPADSTRKRFAFTGTTNQLMGLDFYLFLGQFNFFGEIARSQNNQYAMTSGVVLSKKAITLTFLYRSYAAGFHSLHGRGFGSFSGSPQNEIGFFSGVRFRPLKNTIINAWFDFSRTPWRTYWQEMPIASKRTFFQFSQNINNNWHITLQWRANEREQNYSYLNEFNINKTQILPKLSQNIRLQINYRLSDRFLLRNRIEKKWMKFIHRALWHQSEMNRQEGWIAFQDIRVKIRNSLQLHGRLCFFDAPSNDIKVYAFENSVPGVMTNRMFIGRGSRWYLLAKYKLNKTVHWALKFSSDFFDDTTDVGSGANKIESNTIHELYFLMDFNL